MQTSNTRFTEVVARSQRHIRNLHTDWRVHWNIPSQINNDKDIFKNTNSYYNTRTHVLILEPDPFRLGYVWTQNKRTFFCEVEE